MYDDFRVRLYFHCLICGWTAIFFDSTFFKHILSKSSAVYHVILETSCVGPILSVIFYKKTCAREKKRDYDSNDKMLLIVETSIYLHELKRKILFKQEETGNRSTSFLVFLFLYNMSFICGHLPLSYLKVGCIKCLSDITKF